MTLQQRFAAEIRAGQQAWVTGILDRVRTEIPGLVRDDRSAELAAASSAALLAQFTDALLDADPDRRYDAPEDALRFARHLARADVPVSLLLRSYRLGQELLFGRAAELVDAGDLAGLRDVGLLTFRFVDTVVGAVTEAFEREREAVLRGSALRRERMVDRLLAGETPPLAEVERILGWRMAGQHLAAVLWPAEPDQDASVVAGAAREVLGWAGAGTPLLVPGPYGDLHAWVRPAEVDLTAPPEDVLAAAAGAGVRVAFGEAGSDRQGFVRSRRQADGARRVARYLPGRAVVAHSETALLGLLTADAAAASRFVGQELGRLAEDRNAGLRTTARAYLENGQDTSATAAALGVHRNTVMRRLARIRELVGREPGSRPAETLAGLLLADLDLTR